MEIGQWETGRHGVPTGVQPSPEPQINPYSGNPLPPGFPSRPAEEDYQALDVWGDPTGGVDHTAFLAASDRWLGMAADQAEFERWGIEGQPPRGGAAGPSPAQLAIERSKVHAQNLATYLDATVAQLQTEVAAGRLRLDQAEAEFNRRMDAFSEGGEQMQAMWQWTVPEGATTLHTDIRANLGMEPWESQAIPFDPMKMAWDIMQQSPEIPQGVPSMDPIAEAIKLMEQYV